MTLSLYPPETSDVPVALLKDLSDQQFGDLYSCDRFTASVLANRFRYIVDNMCGQLISQAFSPILRDYTDLSAALTGPPSIRHAMPAVAQSLPLFFGSIPEGARGALEEYGIDQLVDGDVIIVNDPYRAGTHVNDVCFIRPAFVDGEFIGALTIRAHMLDWGGKVMGGFTLDKGSLYEDGLVVAPELIYHAGEPVRPMFKMIRDNTRFAPMVLPDIETINACLKAADDQLSETYVRYGQDAFVGAMRYACDASAETMQQAIAKLPDGDYRGEAKLDSNGLGAAETALHAKVLIRKRGPNIEFDFSGSSAATPSSLNCMWAESKSAVVIATKWLVDPKTPYTSGASRSIDVLVPPDTFMNPSPPLCSNLYWVPMHCMITAIMRALNPVLGEDAVALDSGDSILHVGEGLTEGGEPWFVPAGGVLHSLPWGATQSGDADSGQLSLYLNLVWSGDEPSEADQPYVVLNRDYRADSGGPGQHRGGAGSVVDTLWLEAGNHRAFAFMSDRSDGGGVSGGSPGAPAGAWLLPPTSTAEVADGVFLPNTLPSSAYAEAVPMYGTFDPETNELDAVNGTYHLALHPVAGERGTILRSYCGGGGGWGDPFRRPVDAVLADVRNEYVSLEGAARDYGVVIEGDPHHDPEGLRVDPEATARLRDR
ncbi:MAG: hydantoinase B/oxoprolinase family protein [Acidimicrobiia bacterium]|nr:hydantoinase B/oxoprolinase family protein [Acidimicrobiia bacterium]MYG58496.1 hydantoinase B/oxoprolinase family protein [Acidimicrobiia bacterium]MYJ33746.1 hydantoinase B/oxoprolinase family protein [Acidimicrobiia bacterium]